MKFVCCAVALLAHVAFAATTDASFEAADKYLREESNARACDGFTAFLKANPTTPLLREAKAKQARACMQAGKSGDWWNQLRALANEGEKDFARAWASYALAERGGVEYRQALPLLKQAASGDDRVGKEARGLFVKASFAELERSRYDRARTVQVVSELLELTRSPNEKALARLYRARANLREPKSQAEGEKEMREVGSGESDVADDALYELGQWFESRNEFVAALSLYDQVVKRFSSSTSNTHESSKNRAAEIRRPSVSLSVDAIELPGAKPTVSLGYRNVANAKWVLKKVDLSKLDTRLAMDDEERAYAQAASAPVSAWEAKLTSSAPHVYGSTSFPLDVRAEGVWLLEVDAEGQKERELVLVTSTVTLVKVGRDDLVSFTAEAVSGKGIGGVNAVAYARLIDGSPARFEAKADANGVARFDLGGKQLQAATVWTTLGLSSSYARSWSGSWYSHPREMLGYVFTDRPLFKPGETVGLKVFLRSRADGPSVPAANQTVTLWVRDASGRDVAKPQLTTNAFGTASTTVTLPKAAQLGQYSVYLDGGNQSLVQNQTYFRVEEYKPPEYTVSVAPVGQPKPGEKVKLKVSASFFFGGPVANAQGRALVTVLGWQHRWSPWPEDALEPADPYGSYGGRRSRHRYDDYYYQPQFATHTLPFKTGPDGTAEIEVPEVANANGQDLEYRAEVFVTDASRREVSGSGSVKASSTKFFADVRPDRFLYKPGERVTVKVRAEDANGRPQSPKLVARLVRVTEQSAGGPIAEKPLTLNAGAGTVQLDADALGAVRVEVRDADGGKDAPVLATAEVWLTNDAKPMIPPGNGFQVFIDKAPLAVGQSMRALVVAPTAGGMALLTVENERVQFVKALELNGRAKFVEIPLTGEMAPNAWLSVARFEQALMYQQQVPMRVKGSDVELQVRTAFSKPSTEPGTSLTLSVEPGGAPKGAQYETAVTVVDEALLALEPMRDDFLAFFGRKPRQLLVTTANTMGLKRYHFDRKVPEQAQAQKPSDKRDFDDESRSEEKDSSAARGMAAPASAPAAEMAADSPSPKKSAARKEKASAEDEAAGPSGNQPGAAPVKVRSDFGSSSGWFPALAGKGATSTPVKFTDSLTSWRAVAVVVSDGPHLGVGKATVRTEKPLMVRLQAPRFFTEKDEVTLSAVVTSRLEKAAQVEVSIAAPGFKPLTPANATLSVAAGGEVRFDARFKVEEPGEHAVRAVVKGGGTADAMELRLQTVVHGSAQRQFAAGRLGDSVKVDVELPAQRKAALTRLELTLSPSLLAVMFDGLPYLAQYPYGCVEQTLSRFVPASIAAKAVRDLKLPADRVPADLDAMVDAGLKRLYSFQHSDGGWGWWQSDTTNKWMSAYAVYGLSLGQKAGLPVDQGVLSRGRAYLTSILGAVQNEPETQAFVTFALAETGGAPKSALDFAFGKRTKLSPRGRALVALALLAAKDSRARIAVENLDDVVKAAASRPDAAVGEANDIWSTSAAIEATAYTLMAMARYDLKSPNIKPLTDFLVLRRNGGKWRSTRDTAFALYALTEVATREEASSRSGTFVVLVNGREVKKVSFSKGGLDLTSPVVLGDSAFTAGKNTIEIRRDGAGTGYYALQFDVFNQNDFIKGVGGDVVVKRTYTLLGKPSTAPTQSPTEYGMPLESGTRVRVDLEVKANKAVEFLMVEDLKPAGLESVQLKSGPEVCNFACAHAELRSDRVAMFLQQIPVGVTKLSYELRAEVPGKFAALPARVEAMYAPEIQATSDEMRFEVRDAPEAGMVGR